MVVLIFLLVAIFSPVQPAQAKQSLKFIVENETFLKNLEHTNIDEFNEGETFVGNILKSYFRYTPMKQVTIEAGILFGVPFGADDKINPKEPVISLHLDFGSGLRITAGTLDRQHQLLDAIFNDDLVYTEPIEQGFQLKGDSKLFKQDLWISWEVKETPTRREKFSVGNFSQFYNQGFMIEGQLYWVHYGGQRNNEDGIINNISLAAGVGYSLYPKKWSKGLKFLDEVGVTMNYLYNRNSPFTTTVKNPKSDGSGVLGKIFIDFGEIEFYYQQWWSKDNNFRPDKGDPLYKAKDYKEFGIEKTFLIGEGIFLTTAFKGQWLQGQFVHIDHLSVSWQGEFSLFEHYFEKIKELAD